MNSYNIMLDCFGLVLTSVMLFACYRVKGIKDKRYNLFKMIIIYAILLLVADALSWLLDGKAAFTVLLYIVNAVNFIFGYVIASLFTSYMLIYLPRNNKALHVISITVNAICLIAILLVVVSVFNHMYFSIENGFYRRGPLFLSSQLIYCVVIAIDLVTALCFAKHLGVINLLTILTYGAFPICGFVIQSTVFGLPISHIAMVLSLFTVYTVMHVEQSHSQQKLEAELAQSRISILLSQIQPHFLYNTLGVIQDLCHGKAPEAEQATIEFTEFLRGNVDSLGATEAIPFEKELKHTENYLHLERMRFGDRLKVVEHITVKDFSLPALTLQPAAENAVRYGLMKREQGGTLTISTYETATDYRIKVEDDGVGFDLFAKRRDDRLHIGISSVQSRMEAMCGGTLSVDSKPGIGTVSTLIIPKGEKQIEHHSSR